MKLLKLSTALIFLAAFTFSCEKESDVLVEEEVSVTTEAPELAAKQGPCSGYIQRITYHNTTYCNRLKRQHQNNGSNWHSRWWWAKRQGCLDRTVCSNK